MYRNMKPEKVQAHHTCLLSTTIYRRHDDHLDMVMITMHTIPIDTRARAHPDA